MLGHGLRVGRSPGVRTFLPSALPLTGQWRDLSALPAASVVGSTSLVTDGSDPTFATTLNGHHVATFSGTKDVVSSVAVSELLTASEWSAWMLINVTTIDGDQSFLLDDTDQWFGLVIFPNLDTPGEYFVSANVWDDNFNGGAYRTAQTLTSVGVNYGDWVFMKMRAGGGHLEVGANAGPWTSVTGSDIEDLTNPLRVGKEATGAIAEVGVSNQRLSDADFESVRFYVRARYGVNV